MLLPNEMLPPKLTSLAAAIPPVVAIAAFSSWPWTAFAVLFTTSVPCATTLWLKAAPCLTSRPWTTEWPPTYKFVSMDAFEPKSHLSTVRLL